jgi:uncharacterized membrane protein YuzA (DUF378 family)
MGKSGCMHVVGMLVWLINILATLHLGLVGLDYNIFNLEIFITTLSGLIIPIHYIIGISGLLSLLMFIKALQCKGASICSCNNCGNGKNGDCGCGGNSKCLYCGNDKRYCSCDNNKSATKTM